MYEDFEYNGYHVKYHSRRGMICVIYYEIFDANGTKVDESNSSDEAKSIIDRLTIDMLTASVTKTKKFTCYKKERECFEALANFGIEVDERYSIGFFETENTINRITFLVDKNIADKYNVDSTYDFNI